MVPTAWGSAKKEMKEKIIDRIRSYRDEIVDFTRDLIAVPTENPPGAAYSDCVKRIASRLEEFGIEFELLEVRGNGNDDSGYCLLANHGRGEKMFYFHGHYDVVPADSPEQFQPRVSGEKLYGRGAADMKSGLAAMIFAVRAIKDCGVPLNGRIGLVIVPDEETGGDKGTGILAGKGLLGKNGVGMLTAEPTSGAIWNASRGALTLRIVVKGKPAHVGLHYRGINAFEQMLSVANALHELKLDVETRKTGYPIQPEEARNSILMMGGRSGGGTSFNSVPAECSFTVERRINPEEKLEEEKQDIFRILQLFQDSGVNLEVEILQEGDSTGIAADHSLARILSENVAAVTGQPARFEMCPGLLETRFYLARGVPALAYGPGLLSVSHGPNEFVTTGNILNCAAVYALTAARALP
jgi:succinyl-diaminopimelate desuccinylase